MVAPVASALILAASILTKYHPNPQSTQGCHVPSLKRYLSTLVHLQAICRLPASAENTVLECGH